MMIKSGELLTGSFNEFPMKEYILSFNGQLQRVEMRVSTSSSFCNKQVKLKPFAHSPINLANANRGKMIQSSIEYVCSDETSAVVLHDKKMEIYSQPDLPQTLNHLQIFKQFKINNNMNGDDVSAFTDITSIHNKAPTAVIRLKRPSTRNNICHVSRNHNGVNNGSQSFLSFVCSKLSCYDAFSKPDLTSNSEHKNNESKQRMDPDNFAIKEVDEPTKVRRHIQAPSYHSGTNDNEWEEDSLSFHPSLKTYNYIYPEHDMAQAGEMQYKDKSLMDYSTLDSTTNSFVSEIDVVDYDEVHSSNLSQMSDSVQVNGKESYHYQTYHERNYELSDMNHYQSTWTSMHYQTDQVFYGDEGEGDDFNNMSAASFQLKDDDTDIVLSKDEIRGNMEDILLTFDEENDGPSIAEDHVYEYSDARERNPKHDDNIDKRFLHPGRMVNRRIHSFSDLPPKQRKTLFQDIFKPRATKSLEHTSSTQMNNTSINKHQVMLPEAPKNEGKSNDPEKEQSLSANKTEQNQDEDTTEEMLSFHNSNPEPDDDNSTRYCDVVVTAPSSKNDNKMSLTFMPEKPFKPIKDKQKIVVSSLVCQYGPNQKNTPNKKMVTRSTSNKQMPLPPKGSSNQIVPYASRELSNIPSNKSYRMQIGLNGNRSIVRTKKKKLPRFANSRKAI